MLDDRRVAAELMELLTDSIEGLNAAAERLAESSRPDLATQFERFAAQRSRFLSELGVLSSSTHQSDVSGSTKAAAHRMWMGVKDALAGSDTSGVLEAAVLGEEHAESTYAEAMDANISADLKRLLDRQFPEIRRAHVEVRILSGSS